MKRGELPCPCMASASLLRNSEPDLGFFRPRLAPYVLRTPTPRSFDRFGQHAVDQDLLRVGSGCPTGTLRSHRASWLAAVRPIATSTSPLVYLRASRKGHTGRYSRSSAASPSLEESPRMLEIYLYRGYVAFYQV